MMSKELQFKFIIRAYLRSLFLPSFDEEQPARRIRNSYRCDSYL